MTPLKQQISTDTIFNKKGDYIIAAIDISVIAAKYYHLFYWQEAQLSQRDRATLRVIEYFAKSLKFTQDHSKWHCFVGPV